MDYNDKPLAEKIAAATAVLSRFPDAFERIDTYSKYARYHSSLVSKDKDMIIKYSGVWHNLSFSAHVIMPYTYNDIIDEVYVNMSPNHYSVMKMNYIEYRSHIGSEYEAVWGNPEEKMLEDGFTQKHINSMYNYFLLELTKSQHSDSEVKLIKETLPSHIRNLLPFI